MQTVTTVCYGEKKVWKSRTEAEEYFLTGIYSSEGSEQERYLNIYCQLQAGSFFCSDLV